MKPPRRIGRKFSNYQDAMEWWRDTVSDEDEEREEYGQEEDEMDKFDEWYDEQQDNLAKGE